MGSSERLPRGISRNQGRSTSFSTGKGEDAARKRPRGVSIEREGRGRSWCWTYEIPGRSCGCAAETARERRGLTQPRIVADADLLEDASESFSPRTPLTTVPSSEGTRSVFAISPTATTLPLPNVGIPVRREATPIRHTERDQDDPFATRSIQSVEENIHLRPLHARDVEGGETRGARELGE